MTVLSDLKRLPSRSGNAVAEKTHADKKLSERASPPRRRDELGEKDGTSVLGLCKVVDWELACYGIGEDGAVCGRSGFDRKPQ